MKVAKQNSCFRSCDDQNDEDNEKKPKHVVCLMWPVEQQTLHHKKDCQNNSKKAVAEGAQNLCDLALQWKQQWILKDDRCSTAKIHTVQTQDTSHTRRDAFLVWSVLPPTITSWAASSFNFQTNHKTRKKLANAGKRKEHFKVALHFHHSTCFGIFLFCCVQFIFRVDGDAKLAPYPVKIARESTIVATHFYTNLQ